MKLSDRNVVELVNKLQESGLLGEDLLHTVNGREYVTAAHLKREVTDAVNGAGGRIAVVSLLFGSACAPACLPYNENGNSCSHRCPRPQTLCV